MQKLKRGGRVSLSPRAYNKIVLKPRTPRMKKIVKQLRVNLIVLENATELH